MSCTHINGSSARSPAENVPVHKEECTLCFDSWDSPEGLFVCLSCFNGGCGKHAKQHFHKRNHPLAVHIRRIKKEQPPETESEPPQKITKVAIGVPGGLQLDSEDMYEYKTSPYCFACDKAVPTNEGNLAAIVEAVLKANSASRMADNSSWEHKIQPCEHTLTLQQDPNAPKLGHKSLSHCGECELNSNLWLCLTCGHLGCARKGFLGQPGGNNHGIEHNKATGHPLVVKVGTITPEGKADVHCYSCDELREDSELTFHLGNLGINVGDTEKTEKTVAELELEQNLKMDWSVNTEGNAVMKNLYGPGFTGLRNLGNTCYMASILQVLYSFPEFQKRYFPADNADHRDTCTSSPADCFHCQMTKLADGLLSGRYSKPEERKEVVVSKEGQPQQVIEDQEGVPPRMFKSLVCKDHVEFKTNAQQDAYEFFQFILKTVQQKERVTGADPSKIFDLKLQQRLQCTQCRRVKYSEVQQTEVSLPIPMSMAEPPVPPVENEKPAERYERESKSKVAFAACVNAFTADEMIEFHCPSCNKTTAAAKNYRFGSFPEYLMVHMRRFVFEDWVPRKLAVGVTIPDVVDLESARGRGKAPDEQEFPEEAQQGPAFNEGDIQALMVMGFSRNRCERALVATNHSGPDAAMNWIFEHMEDADIDLPLPKAPTSQQSKSGPAVDEAVAVQLTDMGFTLQQAKRALQETEGNMERAVEWLFSHAGDMDTEPTTTTTANANNQSAPEVDMRPAKYQLAGFIVHIGSSVHCGHYVAFVRKGDQWVQFNDRRVCESATPPADRAYMYFFRRV